MLFLKIKRPLGNAPIDLVPTFRFSPSLQISEEPVEFRPLASAMPIMTETILEVIASVTSALGLPIPDGHGLQLGHEHEGAAAELSGDTYTFRDADGAIHRFDLSSPNLGESDSPS